ncbi:hypothetical protein HY214_04975 [Candidatus Roizmanbacteria bacterium]|nr:hypothetical protein [Candidatus Roizmanbacteria bacterium]
MNIRERIKSTLLKKDERAPFIGSFAVALLSKAPLAAVNTAGIVFLSEKMRENSDLVPLGITAFALFSLASAGLDYLVLKRDRVAGSAKANTLYRGLTFLFPNRHEFNAAVAEIGATLMTVVGINPDPTAPASTIMSIITGDPTIAVAQRISDMAISLVTQVPYNIYLYSRKRLHRSLM